MAASDTALLAAARRGDAQALDALLAEHEPRIYRFGLRLCGDAEAAREVLQETLVAAFQGLPGFRGEAELSTWLYQLARSFCIKERRRRAGEPAAHEDLAREATALPSEAPAPDARAHARELAEALQAALLALSEAQREVVVLRDVEGLSAEQTARVLGEPVSAVKSRLHRARLQLRAHLAALLGEAGADAESCPELAEDLSRYLSREIDQAACAELEAHLARCPRCAEGCAALQSTVSLCRSIPGGAVPAPVRSAVRQALVALVAPRA